MAAGADDWYIDAQGRACLRNAVDLSFEKGAPFALRCMGGWESAPGRRRRRRRLQVGTCPSAA